MHYTGRIPQLRVITTIEAAAENTLLTDLATIKAELNLITTDANRDAVLTRYIAACSQAIQTYCNRVFAPQTIQDQIFPQRDPPISPIIQGVDPLRLSSFPVISVTSVTENPVTMPYVLTAGTQFLIDNDLGQLTRLDRRGFPMLWMAVPTTVIYQAGYATLRPDLVDACIEFVKFRYFARMRDSSIKSENVAGVYEATYLYNGGPGGPNDMPGPIAEKIDRYRVPVIG